MTATASADGRAARGQRTRGAVVEAMLSLIEENDAPPTAARIAERAGVSLRTVFQHYADLETLFATAAERQMELVAPLARRIPAEGPLAERVDATVAQRARILEAVGPVRRAAVRLERQSPEITRRLDGTRALSRTQLAETFGPELSRLPKGEREELLHALHVTATWPVWDTLRRQLKLSVPAASKVVRRTLLALLKGAKS